MNAYQITQSGQTLTVTRRDIRSGKKPEVNPDFYQFTHGRAPRGFGFWAFSPDRNCRLENAFQFRGTYAEAKREARNFFTGEWIIFPLT